MDGRGDLVRITSAESFVAEYPHIMTHRVLDAIRDAEITNVFANNQGVALGRGAVWINGVCRDPAARACSKHDMKITRINNRPIPGMP